MSADGLGDGGRDARLGRPGRLTQNLRVTVFPGSPPSPLGFQRPEPLPLSNDLLRPGSQQLAQARPAMEEDCHQQVLAKNPGGYCGLGGTGVSGPVWVGV